jgi:hypothetical protein
MFFGNELLTATHSSIEEGVISKSPKKMLTGIYTRQHAANRKEPETRLLPQSNKSQRAIANSEQYAWTSDNISTEPQARLIGIANNHKSGLTLLASSDNPCWVTTYGTFVPLTSASVVYVRRI